MDKNQALHNLLNGTASEEEIGLLRQLLASGEISIGGNLADSNVISGSENISVTNRDGTVNIFLTPDKASVLLGRVGTEDTAPVEGEPPYMGLRYFDTQDADLFYGREALSRELLKRVKQEPFLAIVGASGSGKSSVARAGLIPLWKQENERGAIRVITPTARPLENLAACLTRESESVTATSTLMDDLMKDTRSLRLYVKKALGETKLLLLVDQFEETFTLCKDGAERKAFIENLLSLAEADGTARVVITLRADFYHHCFEYESLRLTLEKHQANLGAMTADELRQAITTPAETNGWDFQPGLVDLILSDVGAEPGALPLLSHALLETWKRKQGRTLTLGGYADAGGVKKAITQTAESVYDHLAPAEQTIARGIFLRLTELGEGVQDTRRRVKLDELAHAKEQEPVARVLKTLTDARLVTTEQDSAEVAHEALIREWGTLRKWLDEDREYLRLHRHLTESAQEWERRGREVSDLYRGARLREIQEWGKDHSEKISLLERDFLKASVVEIERQHRATRLRWITFACAGLLVICTIAMAMTGRLSALVVPLDMDNYWVSIPAGDFQMGSESGYSFEKPEHTVFVKSFEIGRYEVTNRQYWQCVRAGVCQKPGNQRYTTEKYALHPVADISWYYAAAFCKWVGGRLPTEAEWEKAARGGNSSIIYPWGNEMPTCTVDTNNGANFASAGCLHDTMPIGSFKENGYGLYDMAGNVWEWTADWYLDAYFQTYPENQWPPNPTGPETGNRRVLRGGSWYGNDYYLHVSSRIWNDPDVRNDYNGFRCARDVP